MLLEFDAPRNAETVKRGTALAALLRQPQAKTEATQAGGAYAQAPGSPLPETEQSSVHAQLGVVRSKLKQELARRLALLDS